MSERDEYSVSNRSLLANASEEDMQSSDELEALAEYKKIVKQISEDQTKLYETRELLRQIHTAGNVDYISMKKSLHESENRIAERINTNDQKLIDLESTPVLNNVLEREKKKAFERSEQRGKEALAAYRERANQTQKELLQQYQNRIEERRRIREQAQVSKKPVQETIKETKTPSPGLESIAESPKHDFTKKMLLMLMPMVLSITIPLLMLETPVWVMTVVDLIILSPMLFVSLKLSIIVPYAYYIINPIVYAWALVVTILGVQDFFAIAFYILLGIQTPRMIKNFIGTICIIIVALTKNKN